MSGDPYRTIAVPEGIADATNALLTDIINERYNALEVERVLVWCLASAEAVTAAGELLGLSGPEYRAVDGPASEIIKQGIELRRRRGTPWALREVLRRLGYGDEEIREMLGDDVPIDEQLRKTYGGDNSLGRIQYNGEYQYNSAIHWATFIVFVYVDHTLSDDEIRVLWDVVDVWKPKRSHFVIGLRWPDHDQPGAYLHPARMITARPD